jgi:hypothetical protein
LSGSVITPFLHACRHTRLHAVAISCIILFSSFRVSNLFFSFHAPVAFLVHYDFILCPFFKWFILLSLHSYVPVVHALFPLFMIICSLLFIFLPFSQSIRGCNIHSVNFGSRSLSCISHPVVDLILAGVLSLATPYNIGILSYVINLVTFYSRIMGARESSRRDDAENPSSGVDYYQLLQLKEDASADEIKVSLLHTAHLTPCLCSSSDLSDV